MVYNSLEILLSFTLSFSRGSLPQTFSEIGNVDTAGQCPDSYNYVAFKFN